MLRLEGYWFPLRSVCIFGRPVCRDGLCPVTHWWRLLLERRPQAQRGLQGIALPPPLCGKGQRVEGTSMLKQICRCCSPSSLHALTLEAAAQLKSGRGGMVWICKTKKMWIPMYLFVIGSLFSLKPQSTILYLEICLCEAASVAVCSHRWSGHFYRAQLRSRFLLVVWLTVLPIASEHMISGAAHCSHAAVTSHLAALNSPSPFLVFTLRLTRLPGWLSVTLKDVVATVVLNLQCKWRWKLY